jgi:hypothetical protein
VKARASSGYSGAPLATKLGIKAGSVVYLVGAPRDYRTLVAPLPDGVRFATRLTRSADIIHIFATQRQRLAAGIASCLPKMRADATIWVSWPKKASKVATDITEDTVRELALPLGLVDIKVCAVDAIWSGLKLVIRKANRGSFPA